LASVCEEFAQKEIHFLKIDVEGAELPAIAGADFGRFRPWILVVESYWAGQDAPDAKAWEELLLSADYHPVYFDGVNRFYVSTERAEELTAAFDYPVGIRDDFVRSDSRSEMALKRIAEMLDSTSATDEHEILKRLTGLQQDRVRFESDSKTANDVIEKMRASSAQVASALSRITEALDTTPGSGEDEVLERLEQLREDRIRFEHVAESASAEVNNLRTEVEQLSSTNAGQAVELEAFWQQSFERERYLAWQTNEIAKLREELRQLAVRLAQLEPRLPELQHRLNETHDELVSQTSRLAATILQVDGLLASTSWRLTLPLRVLRRPGHYIRVRRARR
jgi:hypothetical protein